MPWNYYRRPWRYRYWYRRRRPKRPFRRRFYRRHRVRKSYLHKLKKITVQEWQPPTIRVCHIKGLSCLVFFNQDRLPYNSTMYENSIVPPGHPGLGGFCVMKYTLENLYNMHEYCTNWWTNTNDNLPLCRYYGAKFKLYQCAELDYVFKYSTVLPGNSNKLTYPACHPSMLLMGNNKVIVPSRKTRPLQKGYKTVRITPPPQFQTKWYFQKEICTFPLCIIHAAGCSLQNYYVKQSWDSNNITITHLNTNKIKNRNFVVDTYTFNSQGTTSLYLWYVDDHDINPNEINKAKVSTLIPLTNTKYFTLGTSYEEAKLKQWITQPTQYKNNLGRYAGNPFVSPYNRDTTNIYYSNMGPNTVFSKFTAETQKVEDIQDDHNQKFHLTKLDEPLVLQSRYNPNRDKGDTTKMYLLSNRQNINNWDEPTDTDLILEGFPLWLNIWGFVDFQNKLSKVHKIEYDYMLVFTNTTTDPKRNFPFVILDEDFVNNRTPYQTTVDPQDKNRWYPQIQYQHQQSNLIASCGPGTPKLNQKNSENITIKYDFYFKWGGAPPKMITVDNPLTQTVFPIPNSEHASTSLQNPTQAFESLLYTFDQRNHNLTAAAIQRIKKDWTITELLSSIAEPTKEVPAIDQTSSIPSEETTTEENEETLQQQLLLHKQQQQKLRLRILKLIQTMDI
nr:MAG: ORF1 [TTV-like mini virus]